MQTIQFSIQGYLDKFKNKPQTKARNYKEELALSYLPYIQWVNETFEKDITLFWIATNRYWKTHTPDQYIRLMDWVKSKNCLHPLAVVKLLNKKPVMNSFAPVVNSYMNT